MDTQPYNVEKITDNNTVRLSINEDTKNISLIILAPVDISGTNYDWMKCEDKFDISFHPHPSGESSLDILTIQTTRYLLTDISIPEIRIGMCGTFIVTACGVYNVSDDSPHLNGHNVVRKVLDNVELMADLIKENESRYPHDTAYLDDAVRFMNDQVG
jgi:hypothetical protein